MESDLTSSAAAHAANHRDHSLSILGMLERDDFLFAVQRAAADARAARETCEAMLLWAERLKPYLNSDPQMTVAQALQRYREAQANTSAPGPESSTSAKISVS